MFNSIGIIGYGDFGKLIISISEKKYPDVKVKVFSRKVTPDNQLFFDLETVCKTDIVFVCVPIRNFEEQIEKICDFIPSETVVVDICTVKVHPSQVLAKYANRFKYICTHPMFGPYSYEKIGKKLDGLRIVLTDHNISSEKYIFIKEHLQKLNLNIVELSSDEHDKKLAETLFLTHLIGQTVHNGGFERTDIDTVSFGFLMSAVESVRNDTELFYDVYKFNHYCYDVLEKFKSCVKNINMNLCIQKHGEEYCKTVYTK